MKYIPVAERNKAKGKDRSKMTVEKYGKIVSLAEKLPKKKGK